MQAGREAARAKAIEDVKALVTAYNASAVAGLRAFLVVKRGKLARYCIERYNPDTATNGEGSPETP